MRAENFSMEKIPTTYENKTAETEAVAKKALSIFDSNNDGKLDAKEVKAANEQIKTSGWQAIADKIAISVEQLKTFAEMQLKPTEVDQSTTNTGYPEKMEAFNKNAHHLPKEYQLENLKKKYPADKFEIYYKEDNLGDKKTFRLEIIRKSTPQAPRTTVLKIQTGDGHMTPRDTVCVWQPDPKGIQFGTISCYRDGELIEKYENNNKIN